MLHMLTLVLPKCHRDTLEVLLVSLKWVSSFGNVQDYIGIQSNLASLANVIGPSVLFPGGRVPASGGSTGGGMNIDSRIEAVRGLLESQDQFLTVPEELLPLLHDQDFFYW